jgi:hypothetical protein
MTATRLEADDMPVLIARNNMTGQIEGSCLPGHPVAERWREQMQRYGWTVAVSTIAAIHEEIDEGGIYAGGWIQ